MPIEIAPGVLMPSPRPPSRPESAPRPNGVAHADYLARSNAAGRSDAPTTTERLGGAPTTAERLAYGPTTAERLGGGPGAPVRDENPADRSYVVSTRSFAPPVSFGGGFQGDDRGYSTDPDVTSRIHSTVAFDTDTQRSIGANDVAATSDPSVHHLIPFYQPTETPDVRVLDEEVRRDGEMTAIDFRTRHSGEDAVPRIPIIDMNPSPSLDVNTDLSIVEDREAGTLTVEGRITGDDFPATEVFIRDSSGQAVFLATGKPPPIATPVFNLIDRDTLLSMASPALGALVDVPDRPIADVSVTINTDEAGNFVSVESGGETHDIAAWNAGFEDRDPGFVDPLEPINDAAIETREAYGEIGDELDEGAREFMDADDPFEALWETGEAVFEVNREVTEAGVAIPAAVVVGNAEAQIGMLDAVVPGDGIPFVDLDLPEAPGWWPGS